jgi:hypothetical protein
MAELHRLWSFKEADFRWNDFFSLLRSQGINANQVRRDLELDRKGLWFSAVLDHRSGRSRLIAAILTWLDPHSPNTLIIHLAAGRAIETWIDVAALRLITFANEHLGLKEVRIFVRKGWKKYAQHFVRILRRRRGKARRPLPLVIERDRLTAREKRLQPDQRILPPALPTSLAVYY